MPRYKSALQGFKGSGFERKKRSMVKQFKASGIAHQYLSVPYSFPSQNEALRMAGQTYGKGRFRKDAFNDYKKSMQSKIRVQIVLSGLKPMAAAWFFFDYHEPTRLRDKDNICSVVKKLVLDALVESGIFPNDGWKEVVGWGEHFKKTDEQWAGCGVTMFDPIQCFPEIAEMHMKQLREQIAEWKKLTNRGG